MLHLKKQIIRRIIFISEALINMQNIVDENVGFKTNPQGLKYNILQNKSPKKRILTFLNIIEYVVNGSKTK